MPVGYTDAEKKYLDHRGKPGRPPILPIEGIYRTLRDMAEKTIPLKEACELHGYPYSTVLGRILRSPDLVQAYRVVREIYLEGKLDEMNRIALDTSIDWQRAKMIGDNIKWLASRVMPKQYGDKTQDQQDAARVSIQLNLGGDAAQGRPITITAETGNPDNSEG